MVVYSFRYFCKNNFLFKRLCFLKMHQTHLKNEVG